MLNGYITYEELKLITGFDETLLQQLLRMGLTYNILECETTDNRVKQPLNQRLFKISSVEKWIGVHIY